MANDTRIMMINWYDHFDDKYLKEEYNWLQEIFGANESKIKSLFDCEEFGVFQYETDLHDKMMSFEDGLFEPEYHDNMKLFKEEYFEYEIDINPNEVSDMEFFADMQYQKQLQKIGHMAGGDEREFDRLWTEQFVFGDEECLAY